MVTFRRQEDWTPDGETWLLEKMRQSGLFFNPLIDAGTNLLGLQGETFAPDLFPGTYWARSLVRSGIDFAKLRGWIKNTGPTGDVVEDAMAEARERTSGVAEGVIPGAQQIPATTAGERSKREINHLIIDVAVDEGLIAADVAERAKVNPEGVTLPPEVTAAMDDPASALYREAFKRYVYGDLLQHGLRIFPPTAILYPRMRVASVDERSAIERDPTQDAATVE
jgi:hypothetical protein